MNKKKDSALKKIKRRLLDLLPDSLYVSLLFKKRTGKTLNLRSPKGFNEKLQWLKLYYRDPNFFIYADKYRVKDFVRSRIGGEYLNEVYGVYSDPDEIDWDALPDQFILRCSHGSGFNVICSDKSKLDVKKSSEQLRKWLKIDFSRHSREWMYKSSDHRIICERYLQSDIIDYKFYCFSGKAEFFYISHSDPVRGQCELVTFLNLDWTPAPFRRTDHATMDVPFGRPDNFDEMISIAEKLSRNIPFVRVDLFNVDGKIYFSEMTFFPGGGFALFYPEKYEYEVGKLIELPRQRTKR